MCCQYECVIHISILILHKYYVKSVRIILRTIEPKFDRTKTSFFPASGYNNETIKTLRGRLKTEKEINY